jgi:hypothetical protein
MDKSGAAPLSVLISWKPETEDFLDFTFGEEWTDAAADFTDVLNKLGENFGLGGSGGGLSKALNLIPLPGFTETIQRKVLVKMGILEEDGPDTPLPSGNANIIKMAKRRKTFGPSESGSGLKCDITIKMVCEYEQKFISGIDPTIAWMDIMNNVLSFGTSNSSNYGLSEAFAKKLNEYTSDPSQILTDVIGGIKSAFTELAKKVKEAVGIAKAGTTTNEDDKGALIADAGNLLNKLFEASEEAIRKTVEKYKIEIMGIAHALSGMPSTPWHVTIGNPLRPIFCSGDMLSESVSVKLGSTLSFNDLPSNIKVEFTLKNARPLGMQDILAKFNTGYLRSVNTRRDFIVSDVDRLYTDGGKKERATNDRKAAVQRISEERASSTSGGLPQANRPSDRNVPNKENSRPVTQNN